MRKGQALAVVLLVMAVGVTVALGAVSRSVTEVNVSTVQEEAARALEAAEAGVEAMVAEAGSLSEVSGTLDGSASYNAVVETTTSRSDFKLPYDLENGDAATINFKGAGFAATDNFGTVCWGKTGETSSLELMLYAEDSAGTMRIYRAILDPASLVEGTGDITSVSTSMTNCGSSVYAYSFAFDKDDFDMGSLGSYTMQFLRVKMLTDSTNAQPLFFKFHQSVNTLPAQGVTISSVGTAGEAVQRIKVTATNNDYPPMFDSAVFSGIGLIK